MGDGMGEGIAVAVRVGRGRVAVEAGEGVQVADGDDGTADGGGTVEDAACLPASRSCASCTRAERASKIPTTASTACQWMLLVTMSIRLSPQETTHALSRHCATKGERRFQCEARINGHRSR